MKYLVLLFLSIKSFAGVNLFPEDGSQEIKRWYFSPNEIKYLYKDKEWKAVLETFKKVGVTPINSEIGFFFQDLGLFSTNGELILQHFPKYDSQLTPNYESYFRGFTMEIFTPPDWGDNFEVNLLTRTNTDHLEIEKIQLNTAFIEGGASISGQFANGDHYLIVNHSTFLGMESYYEDLSKGIITEEELINLIEADFNLKPGNFIYLKGTSHIHLDTFMKALPGGKILLDHPESKLSMLEQLRKYSGNKVIDNYIKYERQYMHTFYKSAIQKAKEQLENKFKVISIAGSFTQIFTNTNGVSFPINDINFFNGVSGSFQEKNYFITNKAKFVPELERFWKIQMRNYNILDVYFPGVYKGNAGLDCMGSPSP